MAALYLILLTTYYGNFWGFFLIRLAIRYGQSIDMFHRFYLWSINGYNYILFTYETFLILERNGNIFVKFSHWL